MAEKLNADRIIVIEDYDATRRCVVDICSDLFPHVSIDEFSHASEFLGRVRSYVQNGQRIIVIADHHMPGMSGTDVIDFLQKQNFPIKSILMATFNHSRNDAYVRGVPFLQKCTLSEKLLDVIIAV